MSKLNEVIDKLLETHEILCDQCGSVDAIFNLDISMDALRELNKTPQYVVEARKDHPAIMNRFDPNPLYYKAAIIHGDEKVELGVSHDDLESLTKATLFKLNHAHRLVNLPLITIEQIIFVEV